MVFRVLRPIIAQVVARPGELLGWWVKDQEQSLWVLSSDGAHVVQSGHLKLGLAPSVLDQWLETGVIAALRDSDLMRLRKIA